MRMTESAPVYNLEIEEYPTYFVGSNLLGFSMWAHHASCDPAEIAHLENELARKPLNAGVGVIDKGTGKVRVFPYDETNAFSIANPHLQVAAGHEAAAAMVGTPTDQARGFILGKQGSDWVILNRSHLNRPDGQASTMQMDPQVFNEIVSAIQAAGVQTLIVIH